MHGAAAANLPAGSVVAGYRVECEVGRGAMAVVYRALQVNLQRQVALKILTDELARDDEFVARFFNEARAAAALSHPHIVQAYDAGVAEGDIYYFAMEYVAGETLLQRIEREGTLDASSAVSIALDIAGALGHGWERQRLTHGDIKPENIMVNTNGETKLADFGLAKVEGHDFDAEDVMLTPHYAAPEVIRGERDKSECRADIYAFGATLYHMLAGLPPFPGDDPRDVMRRQLEEPLTPLASRNPAVPAKLSDLVGHLLAKDLDARPADWNAVADLLKKLRAQRVKRLSVPQAMAKAGSGHAAARIERRPKAKSGAAALAICAAGVTLAAVIAAGVAVSKRRSQPPVQPQTLGAPGASLDSDWVKLKGRIAGLRDPALSLRLLEEFQAKHDADAPDDLDWYMREYRKKVANAAAKARAEGARLLAPRVKSVQADGASAEGRAEQLAVLSRVDALLQEDVLGAKDRESLAALRLRLQQATGADGATPTAAKTEVGSSAADGRQHADAAAARADAYIELTEKVVAFQYRGQKELEPLARAARDWLSENPGESPERPRVQFLLDTVLPAAEEFLPRLVTRQEKLVGEKMPGRNTYAGKTVKAISLDRLDLVERTQYGDAVVHVAWSALERPASYMAYFGRLALATPDAAASDRRAYLALLLMANSAKAMTSALSALPAESAEAETWRALSTDVAQAEHEGNALRQWREARKCCERGELINGYQLLRRLESTPSSVCLRYEREIDGWLQRCLPRVPESRAAQLVRRAQEQLSLAPAEALALATTAHTRYGLLDFPEKDAIDTIRGTAIQALRTDWHEQLFRRAARSLAPFLDSSPRSYDHRTFPGLSLLLCQEAAAQAATDQSLRSALPVLRELAKLEVGDWLAAKGLARRPASEAKGLPNQLQPCFWFGRGLVAFRYDAGSPVVGEGTAGLDATRAGDQPSVAAAALGVEYALLTGQVDSESPPWPAWSELTKQQQAPHMKRFCLAALTWLLEAGRTEDALRALRKITDSDNSFAACGFSAFDRPTVEGLATYLEAGVGAVVPQWRTRDAFAERYVRLLVSALASRSPADPAAAEQMLSSAAAALPGKGPVGGTAWFDSLLLKVAASFASDNLVGAGEQVQEAMEAADVNVTCYYPRLCMLLAGLERLSGEDAMARETLATMQLSPVASEAELLCAQAMEAGTGPDQPPRELATGHPSRFWFAWLQWTAIRRGDVVRAERWLGRLEAEASSLSQKRFAASVRSLELGPEQQSERNGP